MIGFQEIFEKYPWNPIKNCPGRYVQEGRPRKITVDDPICRNAEILEFETPKAADTVHVVEFPDGGIVSYRKKDRSYVHILCDPEGFKRKLEQLEIELILQ
jgi:hypothetical protein